MYTYQTYGDQQLFDLLRQGEQAAYAEIYQRYWALLFRHALHMLGEEKKAEDTIQDVFLSLWDRAPQIDLKTTLSGYLYAAVRNRVLDHWSHERVREKYTASLGEFFDQGECQTDFLVRERELRELIEREVALLPEHLRKSFELSRQAHMTYSQIAAELGISEAAVRNNVSRALKLLRAKFGDLAILFFIFNS